MTCPGEHGASIFDSGGLNHEELACHERNVVLRHEEVKKQSKRDYSCVDPVGFLERTSEIKI